MSFLALFSEDMHLCTMRLRETLFLVHGTARAEVHPADPDHMTGGHALQIPCSSATTVLRSHVVGRSRAAICLAEDRGEFGRVGQELPYFLGTAAGDGRLGSPLQRLLA